MRGSPLTLEIRPGALAICRLPAQEEVPAWAWGPGFQSVTRTENELSVVCAASRVPAGVSSVGPWRELRVLGPLAFDEVGILAGLSNTLARGRISIFVISTHDTDSLLVREDDLEGACALLRAEGHTLRRVSRTG